jgi:hypothetical protein
MPVPQKLNILVEWASCPFLNTKTKSSKSSGGTGILPVPKNP